MSDGAGAGEAREAGFVTFRRFVAPADLVGFEHETRGEAGLGRPVVRTPTGRFLTRDVVAGLPARPATLGQVAREALAGYGSMFREATTASTSATVSGSGTSFQ